MRILKSMSGHTRKYKITNEYICEKVGVAPIEEMMMETFVRLFGHVRIENKTSRDSNEKCESN